MVRIVPERLPDMTLPRSGHYMYFANGELTVIGGHTTNFVPTPTAEYFDGKAWHQMPMAYNHDNGLVVVLRSGEAIIGGGHSEPLGIGQTFMVERYTPATHSFDGFGCLDRRRVLANGIQLEDGRVIIAGNHYADDAIGCYDGQSQVKHVKDVRQGRANPYVFPIASDDAVIIGGYSVRADTLDTVWADRVKGEPFRVPLLDHWKLEYADMPFNTEACAIGQYAYLMTATDANGQFGFIVMRDTCFSPLVTACPVPRRSPFGPIFYKQTLAVDRKHQRAYVTGVDDSLFNRQYVLAVDYAKKPATMTLYYTDTLEHATSTTPVVTPDGDLILAGGILGDNYKPLAAVWCYHFGTQEPAANEGLASARGLWPWAIVAMIAAIVAIAYLLSIRRRKKPVDVNVQPPADDIDDITLADGKGEELMERICQLMDDEQLYLRSDLKLQDVAVRLSTNSSYVSECINSVRSQSFSLFINTYRIRHAQELLRKQPDIKTATLAEESGFSTETTFFRNFKIVTGMTPREWLTTLAQGQQ